jgi:DNA-binding CsgD family transcriptional regulator
LAQGDVGQEQRYKWPVMSLAARIEAERAGTAGADGRATPAGTAERIDGLREEADQMPTTTAADHGHLALVRAEHARLRRAEEAEAWERAVEACRSMGEPFPLAYALLRQAEALSGRGEAGSAATSAGEALALAKGMGAAPLLEDIQALIRRARLPLAEASTGPNEPGTAPPDELAQLGLTVREAEVLRLVADGLSNSQIAERLFISRKTASVHVSNILAKLGVATRGEAGALAHRRGFMTASTDA